MEPDNPNHTADRLATLSQRRHRQRVWFWQHEPFVLSLTRKAGQPYMGRGARLCYSCRDKRCAWAGQVQHRAVFRRSRSTRSLDTGRLRKQRLVCRGILRTSSCQSDAFAIFHQLQHERGLVYHYPTNPGCQLAGEFRQRLDGAIRRRGGTNHEAWLPASESHGNFTATQYILREPRSGACEYKSRFSFLSYPRKKKCR